MDTTKHRWRFLRNIASIDSDFDIYRLPNRARLNNVLVKIAN